MYKVDTITMYGIVGGAVSVRYMESDTYRTLEALFHESAYRTSQCENAGYRTLFSAIQATDEEGVSIMLQTTQPGKHAESETMKTNGDSERWDKAYHRFTVDTFAEWLEVYGDLPIPEVEG